MLKTKLLKNLYLIYITLILFSIVAINIALFSFMASEKRDIFTSETQSLKTQIIDDLATAHQNTLDLREQIYLNPNTLDNIYAYSTKTYSDYASFILDNTDKHLPPFYQYTNAFFMSSPSLSSIYLYSSALDRITISTKKPNGHSTYSNSTHNYGRNELFDSSNPVGPLLSNMYMFPYKYVEYIPLNSPKTFNNFGIITTLYDIPTLLNIKHTFPYPIQFTLRSSDGTIVDKSEIIQDAQGNIFNPQNFENIKTTFSIPWGTTDLVLEAAIPMVSAYKNMTHFYIIIPLISMALFLILIIIFRFNLKKMDKLFEQILLLINHSRQGDLDFRISVKPSKNNELILIADQLNKMNQQLDTHIKSVYIAETKQKEAHIKALQNQVNPHFLYNTLEVIRMHALRQGNREVGGQLASLSRLHRNLVKGEAHVSFRKELEFSKSYIEIQGIRHDGIFTYDINCDKDTMSYLVPKFILQPLIENFFKHGLLPNSSANFLTIESSFAGDLLNIIVSNNGASICPEVLSNIEATLNDPHTTESIGLSNVHQRIMLEYGIEYGLRISPRGLGGISFILELPKKGLNVDDKDITG